MKSFELDDPSRFYKIKTRTLRAAFEDGMRADHLEEQPAPWVKGGLELLEAGEGLSQEKLTAIDRSGGTDHPDPWFT